MSSTKSEMLTEANSKAVRLSRALCTILEDMGSRLDQKTINDTLNAIIRPIAHVLRTTHAKKVNLEFVVSGVEYSITLRFDVKEKYVAKKLGESK